jgi:hypothetical protein
MARRDFQTVVDAPSGASSLPQPNCGIHRGGWITLRIFDQQGRLIRDLLSENLSAGMHEARWDGRDGAGRPVPGALYFYRLRTDGKSLTGKVFSLR